MRQSRRGDNRALVGARVDACVDVGGKTFLSCCVCNKQTTKKCDLD